MPEDELVKSSPGSGIATASESGMRAAGSRGHSKTSLEARMEYWRNTRRIPVRLSTQPRGDNGPIESEATTKLRESAAGTEIGQVSQDMTRTETGVQQEVDVQHYQGREFAGSSFERRRYKRRPGR